MLDMLSDARVLERVKAYFNMLKNTGYIKDGTTSRYLLYIFLHDFVKVMQDFLTDEDYDVIRRVLRSLFGDGNCLMPYKGFTGRAHIAKPLKDYTNDCTNS